MKEGDTPFWYAVFRGGGLDGTQYAKRRYAVRKHSVTMYIVHRHQFLL